MVNVPRIVCWCTSQRYVTGPPPVVKFTIHVWCPIPCTSDAQLVAGTHETELEPVSLRRWKLWAVELSSSSSWYAPSGSVCPSSSWPLYVRWIVKSSLTLAVRTGRSYCEMQN